MKRFMLCRGNVYYPSGGMRDYYDSYDDLEEAKDKITMLEETNKGYWFHIYDCETDNIIFEHNNY
jgi:hypothetical protein